MAQHPAQGNLGLPGSGELRPVTGDRRIDVEHAALREHQHARSGHAFRRREHQRESILLPRSLGCAVGEASPQIHDAFAAEVHAYRRAGFAARVEVSLKGLGDALEAWRGESLDRDA